MALKTPILRNGLTDYAPWTGPTREHPRPHLIASQRRRAKHDVRAMLRGAYRKAERSAFLDRLSVVELRHIAVADYGLKNVMKTRKADLLKQIKAAL